MAIESHKIEAHWNYLLAIENDLERLSRYVEFDNDNFNCFSIEILRILLTASAEVDVVCKLLCKKIKSASTANNIHQYRNLIKATFPKISDFRVHIPRYGLKLKPWSNWKKADGVPGWWTAYNKIKHQRDSHYHRANLRNAINALAGLFVIVLYFYKEKAEFGALTPSPTLLRVSNEHLGGQSVGGGEGGLRYIL